MRLSFSKADAPERIVFVLKELDPENWINNGSCYSVQVGGWGWGVGSGFEGRGGGGVLEGACV